VIVGLKLDSGGERTRRVTIDIRLAGRRSNVVGEVTVGGSYFIGGTRREMVKVHAIITDLDEPG
jgi:hypothetical protein